MDTIKEAKSVMKSKTCPVCSKYVSWVTSVIEGDGKWHGQISCSNCTYTVKWESNSESERGSVYL